MPEYFIEHITDVSEYFEIMAANQNCVVGYRGPDAIMWDGKLHTLSLDGPDGAGGAAAKALGTNSKGDIVGSWGTQGFARRADGTTIYLGSLLSHESSLADINDVGLAVGTYQQAGKSGIFTFDLNTNAVVDFGAPALVDQVQATAINNSGDIVCKDRSTVIDSQAIFLLRSGVFLYLGIASNLSARMPQIDNNGLVGANRKPTRQGSYTTEVSVYDIARPQLGWQPKGHLVIFDMNDTGIFAGTRSMGFPGASVVAPGWSWGTNSLSSGEWVPLCAQRVNNAGEIFGVSTRWDAYPDMLGGDRRNFRGTLSPPPVNFRLEHPMLMRWPAPSAPWWVLPPVPHPPHGPWPSSPNDLDANSQEIVRGLMLNRLAQDLTDEQARELIKNASLDVIMRAVERLRR